MKPAQLRKKGNRFERIVAKEIEAEGLGKARREAMSGGGFRKGDIASSLEFMLECKNEKQTNFLPNIDQAKEQARIGNKWPGKWALITMDPRTTENNPSIYATINFWEFLRLLKKNSEPRIKEPDRDAKYKIQRAVESLKALLKAID